MKDIPDKSADMILCDLPFGTTQCKWDSIIPFEPLWEQYERIIKDNGIIILFGAEPFSSLLRVSNIKLFRYDLIWEKTHPVGFLNAKKQPLRSHENIHIFYKKQPVYNPIKTTGHKRKTAVKRKDDTEIYGKQNGIQNYDSTERYPRSVLRFSSDKQKMALHPTQKPLALIEYLMQTYSNKGALVIDNCMGSGTTGEACVRTGRDFIGIELDVKHFETAKHRIERARHDVEPLSANVV